MFKIHLSDGTHIEFRRTTFDRIRVELIDKDGLTVLATSTEVAGTVIRGLSVLARVEP
jgi:hypothetical protein